MLAKRKRASTKTQMREKAHELGVPAEWMTAQPSQNSTPISPWMSSAASTSPNCHLSPTASWRLRKKITEHGGKIIYSAEAKNWAADGRRITAIETTQGDFQADEFLLAAGAWADVTAHQLGLSIPLEGGKGYSLTLQEPRELPASARSSPKPASP